MQKQQRWVWALMGVGMAMVAGCKQSPSVACGDGVCDGSFETCASCPRDCGGCSATCGDGVCQTAENCTSCPHDCGSCTGTCGDRVCQSTSENCSTCSVDCGTCPTSCGDRVCQTGETCSSCPMDCGTCGPVCGDRTCQSPTETCSTCPTDCGSCSTPAQPYQACGGGIVCADARDSCLSVTNRTATRSMCTVSACTTDASCDLDMYGSRGNCISFDGGVNYNCFHRCTTSADCYPGFACYPPTGAVGAIGNICLPDAGPAPLLPPYSECTPDGSTMANCQAGLECDLFQVGTASTHLCSRTRCSTDMDCPLDPRGGRGACLNFGGGITACWERCNVRGDCPNTVHYDCTTSVGGSTSPVLVCVPR